MRLSLRPLALPLSLAVLAACAGDAGPAGPAGPQGPAGATGATGPAGAPGSANRRVYTGTLPSSGQVAVALPAGVSTTNPPVIGCYISSPTAPTTWVQVAFGGDADAPACFFGTQNGVSAVGMIAPATFAGFPYMIVIIY